MPASASAVFDRDAAIALVDGDVAFLREIAILFVGESAEWLADLEMALSQQAVSQVQQLAHCLKGAAYPFAAATTIAAVERLETVSARGDLAEAWKAYRELVREAERLVALLNQFIHSPVGPKQREETLISQTYC